MYLLPFKSVVLICLEYLLLVLMFKDNFLIIFVLVDLMCNYIPVCGVDN